MNLLVDANYFNAKAPRRKSFDTNFTDSHKFINDCRQFSLSALGGGWSAVLSEILA
jgi:hypothetical protein